MTGRLLIVLLIFPSCLLAYQEKPVKQLFKKVDAVQSGITFRNNITESEHFNYYMFMHIYMGAGVAVGDFNNDNLPDIYFVSNRESNKLYLNKGGLEFEDITESAGVGGGKGFYTGVTTVDINQDGYLDIYICRSGPETETFQSNLLYINNGDLTFSDRTSSYGLSELVSHSIQSTFFDYDKDGDLDVYIVNTPVNFKLTNQIIHVDSMYNTPAYKNYGGNDKLYRNNGNNTFTDVSEEAGIKQDAFFGLNVLTSDLNGDGWEDIFVSNDFSGPDFCYINNQDGTFSESNRKVFAHTATFSMGGDIGDINNDGHQDLIVLDMLPADYKRSKTSMTMVPRELMTEMIESGYHKQYMHNMVQLNTGKRGEETDHLFREIGYYSGLAKTDWSWSCLIADFDLDGFNDVHITNGILRDVTNSDARLSQINYFNELKSKKDVTAKEIMKARELFPSVKLNNFLFKNNGDLTFGDISEGNVGPPSFSNGSAMADFDNDGDLDYVCNNVNEQAFLFENLASETNNYLKVELIGSENNKRGIGSKISLSVNDQTQIKYQYVTKGYFSASDDKIIFGLGREKKIDKVEIQWPDGKTQSLKNVKANSKIKLNYKDASFPHGQLKHEPRALLEKTNLLGNYRHKEIPYDDFKHQLLLPHKLSALGPGLAKGDVNGDGLEDVFIAGAAGFESRIFIQKSNGEFEVSNQQGLKSSVNNEDIAACFFDADNDGDLDLYVASGSYEFADGSDELKDRLYFNDGTGEFIEKEAVLPEIKTSTATVISFDLEGDGDLDLFVGGRTIQGEYPYAPKSYLLRNDNGKFEDVTQKIAPDLRRPGMITDGLHIDYDGDSDQDLILVGEWMPVILVENSGGAQLNIISLPETDGWWNCIEPMDYDNDGDIDYLIGNLGLNYKYSAKTDKPFHVYADDLDGQGVIDIVLAKEIQEELFPVRGKMCSSEQMPFIETKYATFTEFAEANIEDIYGIVLKEAIHLKAHRFETSVLLNHGEGSFTIEPLDKLAQLSPVNDFIIEDFDHDGNQDILLAGNLIDSEVETTPGDSGIGLMMLGTGDGTFTPQNHITSGFFEAGNVKRMIKIKIGKKNAVIVANNNSIISTYLIN
ncbi:VCBS repeat-containing protein [Fulvivirgaceae bacterium BMA10]|uniref:VCBS repeat-containing protein n=1 Tax=Splendidivirga corallicola TaxID=3051826 RepID=A0ABT8KPN4_9BACT|nr:VCBS repeat-containing protein [Fulvivirgaceae bacterium BMA10]